LLPCNETKREEGDNYEPCKYSIGDLVYFREYHGGKRYWKPGVIVGIEGPRIFKVESEGGRLERRHLDQLQKRYIINNKFQFPQQALIQSRDGEESYHPGRRDELPPLILNPVPEPSQSESAEYGLPEDCSPIAQEGLAATAGSQELPMTDPGELTRSFRPKREARPPHYLRDYITK
jgi:hypothetical protein